MRTRRACVKQVIGGIAVAAAYGMFPSSRVLGANDRVHVGLIGNGSRGRNILRAA